MQGMAIQPRLRPKSKGAAFRVGLNQPGPIPSLPSAQCGRGGVSKGTATMTYHDLPSFRLVALAAAAGLLLAAFVAFVG